MRLLTEPQNCDYSPRPMSHSRASFLLVFKLIVMPRLKRVSSIYLIYMNRTMNLFVSEMNREVRL